jgi:hypothetical protein
MRNGFEKLGRALQDEGVEVLLVDSQEEFLRVLYSEETKLIVYPIHKNSQESLNLLYDYMEDGGRVAFIVTQHTVHHADLISKLYGVEYVKQRGVNGTGGTILNDTLPEFIQEKGLVVETRGSMWIQAPGYIITDKEGDKNFYTANGEMMSFFSAEDKSVSFIMAVAANEPYSDIFFDDVAIEHGEDNREAAVLLFKYLLE